MDLFEELLKQGWVLIDPDGTAWFYLDPKYKIWEERLHEGANTRAVNRVEQDTS